MGDVLPFKRIGPQASGDKGLGPKQPAEEITGPRRRPKGPPVRRRRAPVRRFGDEDDDDGPAEPLGPGDEPGK